MKSEPKTVLLDYEEVKVPGGFVDWRFDGKIVKEYRFPTVVRISRTKTKGEYYKSVHAAKTTPGGKMIGLYLGALVESCRVRDGSAWQSHVIEVILVWTARFPRIGRGRDT